MVDADDIQRLQDDDGVGWPPRPSDVPHEVDVFPEWRERVPQRGRLLRPKGCVDDVDIGCIAIRIIVLQRNMSDVAAENPP